MTASKGLRTLGWLQVRICLCAFALLLAVPPLGADTVPGGFRQAPQIPVWIQDPWTGDTVLAQYGEPDKSLWNGARVDDYREALAQDGAPALGILTIEKLNIQVPIYNGTDEYNLNRGVGRIKGMAKLRDDSGNLGLSGHRDGFFRGLKDMQVGDEIEVQTPQGVDRYGVDSITIVPKSDVSVLDPTDERMLTIVTCYPFYFVGNAPKRYIVRATPR
jgi:sortase A